MTVLLNLKWILNFRAKDMYPNIVSIEGQLFVLVNYNELFTYCRLVNSSRGLTL